MKARISQTGKNAMQSGRAKVGAKTGAWVLEYETTSRRTPEDLMGWTSSKDTLNQVQLKFDNCDDAINFAKGKGWEYIVTPVHERKVVPRNYGDNFK